MNNRDWIARDLAVLWHPCTQMKDHETLPLTPIKRGEGVWLEDFEGQRYLDMISSWWVNLFGHCHPYISEAIAQQARTLEHVLLAGFSHEAVTTLSERLVALTPQGLSRCFYADNGSSAVEVALKMSYQFWRNQGKWRKRDFVTLANSYHGETLGALAVGDVALYKQTFEPLMMKPITAPSPDCFQRETGETCAEFSLRQAERLEAIIAYEAETISAVIVEPLVQCAGGMRMYDPVFLSKVREACDRNGVHLIADEIAVGFGRTGTMFACEQAGITPDFLCLSKGITGGYLPLSVVLTTDAMYDAFYDDYQNLTAFMHSHSYTGNPLACSAAHATLDLFERDNVIVTNQSKAAKMAELMADLQDHPHVGEVRQTGMILAVEMVAEKAARTPYPWQQRRGLTVYQHGLKKGVLLRPLGNVVYFMPPYVISDAELELAARVAHEGIDLATAD